MKRKESLNRLAERISETLGLEVWVKSFLSDANLDVLSPTGLRMARYGCIFCEEKKEWVVSSYATEYVGISPLDDDYVLGNLLGMTEVLDAEH